MVADLKSMAKDKSEDLHANVDALSDQDNNDDDDADDTDADDVPVEFDMNIDFVEFPIQEENKQNKTHKYQKQTKTSQNKTTRSEPSSLAFVLVLIHEEEAAREERRQGQV